MSSAAILSSVGSRLYSRTRVTVLAAITLLLLIALFTVPYHVPMTPSVSLSYAFGYSNRAALVLIGLWLVAMAALSPGMAADAQAEGKPLTRSTVRKAMAITFVVSFALYLLTRTLNGFDESIYLVDRLWHALAGQRPYIDFEYAYGAGFLYGPWLLAKVLRLPLGDAYGLFFVTVSVTGVWLLGKTLSWVQEPLAKRRTVFLFVWAFSLLELLSTGVNYSLLRFLLPCALGVLLFRQTTAKGGAAMLLALPYTVAVLLVSPELGVAYALGAVAMSAWLALRKGHRGNLLWVGMQLVGLALEMLGAARLGVFRTLAGFGSGGYNFPVLPGVFLLAFLTTLALAALYAGRALREGQPTAVLMLIAVSAAALPAALGRCDPVHMFEAPLGITLAALLVASRWRAVWHVYLPAMVLLYLLLPLPGLLKKEATLLGKAALPALLGSEPASETSPMDRFIQKRMAAELGPEKAAEKFADVKMLAHMRRADITRMFGLATGQMVETPFGFTPTRFGIDHSPQIAPGRFSGAVNVVSVKDVATKIDELRAHPDRPLLLLRKAEDSCGFNEADDRQTLSVLFLVPFRGHERPVRNPLEDLCSFIQGHYNLTEPATPEHFGYALWSAK